MEADQTVLCQLLAVDLSDYCYRVCSRCERVLPGDNSKCVFSSASSLCKFCQSNEPKLLYRVLVRTQIEIYCLLLCPKILQMSRISFCFFYPEISESVFV